MKKAQAERSPLSIVSSTGSAHGTVSSAPSRFSNSSKRSRNNVYQPLDRPWAAGLRDEFEDFSANFKFEQSANNTFDFTRSRFTRLNSLPVQSKNHDARDSYSQRLPDTQPRTRDESDVSFAPENRRPSLTGWSNDSNCSISSNFKSPFESISSPLPPSLAKEYKPSSHSESSHCSTKGYPRSRFQKVSKDIHAESSQEVTETRSALNRSDKHYPTVTSISLAGKSSRSGSHKSSSDSGSEKYVEDKMSRLSYTESEVSINMNNKRRTSSTNMKNTTQNSASLTNAESPVNPSLNGLQSVNLFERESSQNVTGIESIKNQSINRRSASHSASSLEELDVLERTSSSTISSSQNAKILSIPKVGRLGKEDVVNNTTNPKRSHRTSTSISISAVSRGSSPTRFQSRDIVLPKSSGYELPATRPDGNAFDELVIQHAPVISEVTFSITGNNKRHRSKPSDSTIEQESEFQEADPSQTSVIHHSGCSTSSFASEAVDAWVSQQQALAGQQGSRSNRNRTVQQPDDTMASFIVPQFSNMTRILSGPVVKYDTKNKSDLRAEEEQVLHVIRRLYGRLIASEEQNEMLTDANDELKGQVQLLAKANKELNSRK